MWGRRFVDIMEGCQTGRAGHMIFNFAQCSIACGTPATCFGQLVNFLMKLSHRNLRTSGWLEVGPQLLAVFSQIFCNRISTGVGSRRPAALSTMARPVADIKMRALNPHPWFCSTLTHQKKAKVDVRGVKLEEWKRRLVFGCSGTLFFSATQICHHWRIPANK